MTGVETELAVLCGILVACGAYLMMSSNLIRFLFGFSLLGNAVNLVIFTAGRMTYAAPPFVPEGAATTAGQVANALPQALILTAIVIGFGLLAFTLALILRAYATFGTADSDELREAEPVERPAGLTGREADAPVLAGRGSGSVRE